jgi:hypothetical protein
LNVCFENGALNSSMQQHSKIVELVFQNLTSAESFVQFPDASVELGVSNALHVHALGEIPSQQPVRILVGTTSPRMVWITKVNLDVGRQSKALVQTPVG